MSATATEVPIGTSPYGSSPADPYGGTGGLIARAAAYQTATSAIAATARVTHQPLGQLDADIRQLARDFPIGERGAIAAAEGVQRLGLSGRNQVPQLRAVSREVVQLALATNTSIPAMATGFGQLNRQMASLDPARLSRMGDVLTTVSAKSGAYAGDILSFAHGIAPLAQQAGIGEAAVLGISGAFAKLGDDSGAAITAVNKILGDLNRSVREGSNDMAAYAQITGMTVDQFRKLYAANPAQALAAVTTAIGKAGPRGSYQLETLGLEGVRTQRALLELSQSGGLSAAVNQAVGSYGNGSTQQAAAAATRGLDDALTRLHTTAGQVGEVLAGPVLKPMTAWVNLLQRAVGPLASVAGSRGVQDLATAGVYGAGAFYLGRRVLGGTGTAGAATLIGTSGPVRGFAGGLAAGRAGGDLGGALNQGLLSRFGGDMLLRAQAGAPLGRGPMDAINATAMRAGATVGGMFPLGGTGYGVRQAITDLPHYGGAAAGVYFRSQAEILRNARLPSADRQFIMRPFGKPYETFADTRDTLRSARDAGQLSPGEYRVAIRGALGSLRDEVTSTNKIWGPLRQGATGFGQVLKETALFGGFAAKGAVKGGVGLLGGLVGSIGLPTLALGAGVAAYSLYQRGQAQNKAFDSHVENLDIYGAVNAYRDAVGKAGEASITLADQMVAAAKTVASSAQSFPQAHGVSNADVVAATSTKNKMTRSYAGSNAQIQAQIRGLDLGGLQPSDLEGAKLDLLRSGMDPARVRDIVGGVTGAGASTLDAATIGGLVGGAAKAPGLGHVGFGLTSIRRMHLPGEESEWQRLGHANSGAPQLGKQAGSIVDELTGALGQERYTVGQQFGDRYAAQRELGDADKAMGAALKTHRADLVVGMEQQLSKALTGKTLRGVSASDIEGAGGFEQLLAARGSSIGGTKVADLLAHPVAARLQASYMEQNLTATGASALVPFFSNARQRGAAGAAQALVAGSVASPENLQMQSDAVNGMVTAAQKAGVSLAKLAGQAGSALATTGSNDVNYQLLLGVISESQRRLSVQAPFMTAGQSYSSQAQLGLTLAGVSGSDTNAQQLHQQGLSSLADLQASTVASFKARIMAQRQYEVTSSRAEFDYQRGRLRSNEDFDRQLTRMTQDAAAQMFDPYQRIQAKPTWDAFNLIGNRREQLTALRQQYANIRELKRLGMSDASIAQLDLYNPANSQQVAELTSDLAGNRGLVGQYNKVATQFNAASGALLSVDPTYRRQRQDFKTAMARQAQDFATSKDRMLVDLHTTDLAVTGSMTSLQSDMNKILHGQQLDWSHVLVNSLSDTLTQVRKYSTQITTTLNTTTTGNGSGVTAGPGYAGPGGGRAFTGTPEAFQGEQFTRAGKSAGVNAGFLLTGASRPGTGMNRFGNPDLHWGKDVAVAPDNRRLSSNARLAQSMATPYGWGGGPEWAALFQIWQQESGFSTTAGSVGAAYGIPQSDPGKKMASFGADWRTNPKTQIGWGLDYISSAYGDPLGAWAHKSRTGWYGEGSIFTGPQMIGVGEKGNEAVLPLDPRGVRFLADVMTTYLGGMDHRMLGVAAAGGVTIHHSPTTIDARNDFTGAKITVETGDPDKLGDLIDERARERNLTATRGVRPR